MATHNWRFGAIAVVAPQKRQYKFETLYPVSTVVIAATAGETAKTLATMQEIVRTLQKTNRRTDKYFYYFSHFFPIFFERNIFVCVQLENFMYICTHKFLENNNGKKRQKNRKRHCDKTF